MAMSMPLTLALLQMSHPSSKTPGLCCAVLAMPCHAVPCTLHSHNVLLGESALYSVQNLAFAGIRAMSLQLPDTLLFTLWGSMFSISALTVNTLKVSVLHQILYKSNSFLCRILAIAPCKPFAPDRDSQQNPLYRFEQGMFTSIVHSLQQQADCCRLLRSTLYTSCDCSEDKILTQACGMVQWVARRHACHTAEAALWI